MMSNKHESVWYIGVVSWYDPAKNFGFINADDGKSVFIHLRALQKNHLKPVDFIGGMRVKFTATERPNRANREVDAIQMLDQ